MEGGGMTIFSLFEGVCTTGGRDGGCIYTERFIGAEAALVVVSGGLVPDLELIDSFGTFALGGGQGG